MERFSVGGAVESMASGPDGAVWIVSGEERRLARIGSDGQQQFVALSEPVRLVALARPQLLQGRGDRPAELSRQDPAPHPGPRTDRSCSRAWRPLVHGGRADDRADRPRRQDRQVSDPRWRLLRRSRAGPRSNLWFTHSRARGGPAIGSITPRGEVREFSTHLRGHRGGTPISLAFGPEGDLWFSETISRGIGRLAPRGRVEHFFSPDATAPTGIAFGPEGNLWFGSSNDGEVGVFRPPG